MIFVYAMNDALRAYQNIITLNTNIHYLELMMLFTRNLYITFVLGLLLCLLFRFFKRLLIECLFTIFIFHLHTVFSTHLQIRYLFLLDRFRNIGFL